MYLGFSGAVSKGGEGSDLIVVAVIWSGKADSLTTTVNVGNQIPLSLGLGCTRGLARDKHEPNCSYRRGGR